MNTDPINSLHQLTVDHKNKTIKLRLMGAISIAVFVEEITKLLQIKEHINLNYNLFLDLRAAQLQFSPNMIDEVWLLLSRDSYSSNVYKVGIIVNDPYSTAITTLLKLNSLDNNIVEVGIFCTTVEANKWLAKI